MRAVVVADMAYGDCGKGMIVDYLVRENKAQLVVRYNGGAQAAHNVVTPEGVHHTFAQYGSGTLAGARTFLSKYVLVDPMALLNEQLILNPKIKGGIPYVMIDPDCVIVTPWHMYANKLREVARGADRHGSVGMGVGEARGDALRGLALRMGDVQDRSRCQSILETIRGEKLAEMKELFLGSEPGLYMEMLEKALPADWAFVYAGFLRTVDVCTFQQATEGVECAVFEGAQGVLLDEIYGFPPYNSWTDCTFGNAARLFPELVSPDFVTVGVFRSYFTRHGPGPFVTEDPEVCVPERHNQAHPWMGDFRQGHFDMVMAAYACSVAAPDVLAVTHMDCRPSDRVCDSYSTGLFPQAGFFPEVAAARTEQLLDSRPSYRLLSAEEFILALEEGARCSVRYLGFGPCSADVVKR